MSVLRFQTSLQKITESSLDRPKPSQKSCGLRSGPFEDHLLNIHDDRGKQDCIGVICFHWSPTFGNTWSWYTFTLIFTLLSMKIRKQFTVVVIPVKTVNPFGKKRLCDDFSFSRVFLHCISQLLMKIFLSDNKTASTWRTLKI